MAPRVANGKIVAVSACIPWNERVLIVRRSEAEKFLSLHWEQPGGKVEEGEGISDAVVREVLEETRLAVRPTCSCGTFDYTAPDGRKVLEVLIRCKLAGPTNVLLSSEHDAFRWVAMEELGDIHPMTEFMRHMIRQGMARDNAS